MGEVVWVKAMRREIFVAVGVVGTVGVEVGRLVWD